MPSIEIICLGQREPTDFCYLPCAVAAETTLLSHRDYQLGPSKVRRYKRPITLEKFWQRHDEKKLWVNASFSFVAK